MRVEMGVMNVEMRVEIVMLKRLVLLLFFLILLILLHILLLNNRFRLIRKRMKRRMKRRRRKRRRTSPFSMTISTIISTFTTPITILISTINLNLTLFEPHSTPPSHSPRTLQCPLSSPYPLSPHSIPLVTSNFISITFCYESKSP
jgi:sterol desaturase/sphingolipid hydroxylase (fatty acid hydroxylase superfamily)